MRKRGAMYFAFGSNMCRYQMQRRCPAARFIETATLDGYGLAFVGASRLWDGGAVATVLPHPDGRVDGALYWLTADDLAALDAYEGHPRHYRRSTMAVRTARGLEVQAQVYVLPGTPGLPSPGYFHHIVQAYERLGLDPTPVCAAVREGGL